MPPDPVVSALALAGTTRVTPRARALIRAYEVASEAAARTRDTRDELNALSLKQQAEAELQRVPGAPSRGKRTNATWRW
jgi:molybdenum-dependent DNA-binding transcriptional regulator ModE